MWKRLLNVLWLVVLAAGVQAQELNCKVTVLHDKITGVDAQVFNSLQKALNEFMNEHKWSKDDFGSSEKIDCTMLINLTQNNVGGNIDVYNATLSIQATRPVYNTGYYSNLVKYVDNEVTFNYSQFSVLNFDDNAVSGTDPLSSNLTAVMAYYAYLIMGLDYDSFSPEGGTPFFKKAQNIVSNAPDSKGIGGWKAVESTRNRYWIIDELLNPRFADIRGYWYTLHREGLDSMSMKPTEACTRILSSLKKVSNVNRDNPSSILLQFFFNAKGDELLHILEQEPKAERAQYISMLAALDVPDAGKFNALK